MNTPLLEGKHVRLEPLTMDHLPALCDVGLDVEIWRWFPVPITDAAAMEGYIRRALEEHSRGTSMPFATIERATGRVVGSTRFMNIAPSDKRLEIGSTWIAPPWQRTAVNTEAKLLMLRYAFETLGCRRVEFKTDSLNDKSRKAIARLGALEEGTFRNHMVIQGGRMRHSVYFSIIDSEWPAVRNRLEKSRDRAAGTLSVS